MNEESYYVILTDVGNQKLTKAALNGSRLNLKTLVVGDANGEDVIPDPKQTALTHKLYSGLLENVTIDSDVPSQINCEHLITKDNGGFLIREIGILDSDGELIAIGNFPQTYKPSVNEGTASDLWVRIQLRFDKPDLIVPVLNTDYIYASKKFVADSDNALKAEILKVEAKTDGLGLVKLATADETLAMTNAQKSVTPASLKKFADKKSDVTHSHALSAMGFFKGFCLPVQGSFGGSGGKFLINPVTGLADPMWHICDGTDGTPDLRDKFMIAAGTNYKPGTTGGSNSHTHDTPAMTSGSTVLTISQIPSHQHHVGNSTNGKSLLYDSVVNDLKTETMNRSDNKNQHYPYTNCVGGNGGHTHSVPAMKTNESNHLPPYYTLTFVMKMN